MSARELRSAPLVFVSLGMTGAYLVQMIYDSERNRHAWSYTEGVPIFGVLSGDWPVHVHTSFWAAVIGGIVAAVLTLPALVIRLAAGPERGRVPLFVIGVLASVALLAPYLLLAAVTYAGHAFWLLLCIPTTAAGLWLIGRLPPRRVPWWLLAGAVAWGATVAYGFGHAMNIWFADWLPGTIDPDADGLREVVEARWQADTLLQIFGAAAVELAKGAGVGVLVLLFRQRITGLPSGLALGAATGLGVNLAITVAQGGVFPYWTHQVVGLLAGETVFAALIGAAFGATRQIGAPKLRRIIVTCGFLAAIGTHAFSNIMIRGYAAGAPADGTLTRTLVVAPLVMLATQLPALALCGWLLWSGIRSERGGLSAALAAEIATGRGAVLPEEATVLLSPARRWSVSAGVLRRSGWAGYRALSRLFAAQEDLAAAGWRMLRGDADSGEPVRSGVTSAHPGGAPVPPGVASVQPGLLAPADQLEVLRQRVMARKAELAAATA